MTPPTPQAMVLPTSGTSQPTETSVGSTYLKILEDVMGKFSPSGKMSEVFSKLAKKFKEEEGQVTPIPIGNPTEAPVKTEPAAQLLVAPPTSQTHAPAAETTRSADNREQKAEFEERMESGEEGNSRGKGEIGGEHKEGILRLVGEESVGKALEVINVEEEESADDRETLDERAIRGRFRTRRGLEREELVSLREKAAVMLAAKREAAERKMKGKQVATPSRSKKSRPASIGVVIREVATNPTQSTHSKEE